MWLQIVQQFTMYFVIRNKYGNLSSMLCSLYIKKDDIIVEGQVTEYSKIADSGNERIQGFCGTCGCQLYARAPDKSVFNVRTGFLKQHHTLTPAKHIFGQSKVAWIKTIFEGKWHVAGPDSDEMKP